MYTRKTKRNYLATSFSSMRQNCKEAVDLALACGVSWPSLFTVVVAHVYCDKDTDRLQVNLELFIVSVYYSCYDYSYSNFLLYLWTVSKAIMNAHDGDLWVKSSGIPGEGAVFGMALDVAHMSASPDEAVVGGNRGDGVNTMTLSAPTIEAVSVEADSYYDLLHIMVVDDSPMNRRMLMLHLNGFGIKQILQASNGLEAVEAVERRMSGESDDKVFDIIYMDCLMPVMGGNEATRRIREMGFAGAIVSVTGNGLPDDVREIMAAGSNVVLVKPVSAKDVANSIQSMYTNCFGYVALFSVAII